MCGEFGLLSQPSSSSAPVSKTAVAVGIVRVDDEVLSPLLSFVASTTCSGAVAVGCANGGGVSVCGCVCCGSCCTGGGWVWVCCVCCCCCCGGACCCLTSTTGGLL